MVVVNVQVNGNVFFGFFVGDFVQINGGMYQVVLFGIYGSFYNFSFGYWLMKYDFDVDFIFFFGLYVMIQSV